MPAPAANCPAARTPAGRIPWPEGRGLPDGLQVEVREGGGLGAVKSRVGLNGVAVADHAVQQAARTASRPAHEASAPRTTRRGGGAPAAPARPNPRRHSHRPGGSRRRRPRAPAGAAAALERIRPASGPANRVEPDLPAHASPRQRRGADEPWRAGAADVREQGPASRPIFPAAGKAPAHLASVDLGRERQVVELRRAIEYRPERGSCRLRRRRHAPQAESDWATQTPPASSDRITVQV